MVPNRRNLQIEFDNLSRSLKKIRESDDYLVEEIVLSQFDWAGTGKVAIESIRDWYKSTQYQRKYHFYKKILKEQIDAYTISWESSYFSFEQTYSDVLILKELVALADALSQKYDPELEKRFYQLECVFKHSATLTSPYLYSDIYPVGVVSDRNLLERTILHKVRDLISVLKNRVNRDLRSIFRAIVRFLFKNLDDESHDVNVFEFKKFKKSFISKRFFQWNTKIQLNIWSRCLKPAH